ncbi:MAG TPA: flagellar basal body P-ring protein FlgI [Sphingomicrobium sp.]|nr:flagellar basal body P-ring protein FlgI [Sphingomicrobium sp.]
MRAILRIVVLLGLALAAPAQAERIKDLGQFDGLRANQLTGYGVVVGLSGTGDDSLDYSTLGVKGAVSRFGLSLPAGINPALKNAAAVLITAELQPFAKPGQRLDVTVSAIGKAKSLRGGTLILAPLLGADGQIYAMAQGNLVIGGLGVDAADGSKTIVNSPTAGRIEGGATIERSVETGFASKPELIFNLTDYDLTSARLIADEVNRALGAPAARAVDGTSIRISAPAGAEARVALMSRIENLEIVPAEAPARVIVNARTGTVVINGAVRVGPAAVTHGKLTVRIDEEPQVSQPAPFSGGRTVVTPSSVIQVEEQGSPMFLLPRGARLSDIVDSVNRLGASPGDLVAILGALKQAGALRAELIVQ